ncbi:unnamed protein product (macronuclear) [Paramecium tetraurelia]|uniref:MORN repeat protein n=1 Tax=Paramecium tetraurelia TaxID=5888 RepID=A0E5M3_PARTE|nr:uncharacterized protein GSPATT00003451001 [Paramecium tetraurelia]CAK90590.1 unnamed protein product [Paramecium tetraurelia]|eukprot:XP_001457987.1 hypothetical protein (macronuclear) [Paramecium tetraurelia strain d4-2]
MGATCSNSCCTNDQEINSKGGADKQEVVLSKNKSLKESQQRNNKETERFNADNDQGKSDASIGSIKKENILIQSTIGKMQRVQLEGIGLIHLEITFSDGTTYKGEWMNGLKDGQGVLKWPSGSIYSGFFLEGKLNGKGKLVLEDEDYYEGEWKDDKCNGFGVYMCKNGARYEGNWKNDKQHGKGKEIWQDGNTYEGFYNDGKKHGQGILKFSNGTTYEGDFSNNELEGQGTMLWDDKRVYKGQWKKSKMNGYGVLTFPDGRVFRGHFQDDKKNGVGEFTWSDGKKMVSTWNNGKLIYKLGKQNGIGICTNGDRKIGYWEEGKRTKWLDEQERKLHSESIQQLELVKFL